MKQKLFSKKVWIPILVAFLAVQLVVVSAYLYQNYKGEQFFGERDFLRSISHDAQSRMSSLTYDPQSDRYYLPELRVSFPYDMTGHRLGYYQQSSTEEGATIFITGWPSSDFRTVNSIEDTMCVYDAYLSTESEQRPSPEYVRVTDVMLENGKTMSVYKNDQQDCKKYVDSVEGKALIEYLQQAKSF